MSEHRDITKVKRVLKIGGMVVGAVVVLVVGAAVYLLGPIFITGRPPVDGFEIEGIRRLRTTIACAHSPVLTNGIAALTAYAQANGGGNRS